MRETINHRGYQITITVVPKDSMYTAKMSYSNGIESGYDKWLENSYSTEKEAMEVAKAAAIREIDF